MTNKNLLIGLSFIGILISSYLAYAKVTTNPLICGIDKGCDVVQTSSYSTLFGIPLGFWGIAFYLALVVLFSNQEIKYVKCLTRIMVLWGVGFSVYLTSLEAFVLHAYCYWCLASAINTVVIAGLYFKKRQNS